MKFGTRTLLMAALVMGWHAEVALAKSHVYKGIAGGNHKTNPDFDFKLTVPGGWDDASPSGGQVSRRSGRDDTPVPAEVWQLTNQRVAGPKEASWMNVEFFSSLGLDDMKSLQQYLNQHHGDQQWSEFSEVHLAGFRSLETVDPNDAAAKLGHIYYFMERNMIVAVHWRRHAAHDGDRGISELLLSMDRETAPPVLKSIRFSPSTRVRTGERVCAHFAVDDLKSSFVSSSLTRVDFAGIPRARVWENVIWDEALSEFRVCFPAPTNVTQAADLMVVQLRIENERDNQLSCSFYTPNTKLYCNSYSSYSPRPGYEVDQILPEVQNPRPDKLPPEVLGLDVERTGKRVTLKVRIQDEAGISGGWVKLRQIPGNDDVLFIPPWQLHGDTIEVDLSESSSNGTRRVSELILADGNFTSAVLVDCNLMTKPVEGCKVGYYAVCQDQEICRATDLKVVEYFSSRVQ